MTAADSAIRKANTDDVNAICALSQDLTDQGRRQFLQRAVDCGDAYVALLDGRVVGVAVMEHPSLDTASSL